MADFRIHRRQGQAQDYVHKPKDKDHAFECVISPVVARGATLVHQLRPATRSLSRALGLFIRRVVLEKCLSIHFEADEG